MHLKVKSQIHDYQILCVLGEGRYSIVYKVQHIPTKIDYAMKYVRKGKHLYNKTYVNNEKNIIQFLPEHEFIVKHVLFHEEDDFIYFIMEYLNGFTLDREIIEGVLRSNVQISFECKKNYILQVVEALKVLHASKIYHCDIKPGNLVVLGETIKVIDFSCAFRSETEFVELEKKSINTTPGHGPPEIYDFKKKGAALFLPAIDCWSLGIIIFFVFSGKNPFHEKFVGENFIFAKNVEINFSLVPPEIADICKGIFKENPTERLTIGEVGALFKTLNRETVEL